MFFNFNNKFKYPDGTEILDQIINIYIYIWIGSDLATYELHLYFDIIKTSNFIKDKDEDASYILMRI